MKKISRSKIILFSCLLFINLFINCIYAEEEKNELTESRYRLTRIDKLITNIEYFVEEHDIPRLFLLRKITKIVLNNFKKHGLGNMTKIHSYQEMLIKFRYSRVFLSRIRSERVAKWIDELGVIIEKINKARGFDNSPYSKITYGIFNQITTLFKALKEIPNISDESSRVISKLIPKLARVVAIADQGDRRGAYDAGDKIYCEIKEHYNRFSNEFATGGPFEMMLEIRGLNEFYAEYAEFAKFAKNRGRVCGNEISFGMDTP